MTSIERVTTYRQLRAGDTVPPRGGRVFFEPADTELGAWVAVDLITPGCTVLDLGSGGGAAAAAMAWHAHLPRRTRGRRHAEPGRPGRSVDLQPACVVHRAGTPPLTDKSFGLPYAGNDP